MNAIVQALPLPLSFDRWRSWRKGLFGSPLNSAITLAYLGFLYWVLWPFVRWATIGATWFGTADACAASGGACWAFVVAKIRFILFGLYPPAHQEQPAAALVLMLVLVAVSLLPRFWKPGLIALWGAGLIGAVALMGGAGPLTPMSTDVWGGFSLTMLIFLAGMALAFPLAILLALGRRSRMGGVRLLSIIVIEVTRGMPFIAVLYAATLLFPLMLPAGARIDKLLRAEVAIIIFIAAFLAETIRGGLQAVPTGQYEAARALGLSYWQMMRYVILPQALRTVIPSMVNILLNVFQDTTLVLVIGLFDFLNAARVAATDRLWLGFYNEAYSFAALVYFVFCLAASRYSLWLERRVNPHHQHRHLSR